MANVERCDPAVYRQQWEYYYSDYILVDRFEPSLYLMGFVQMIYTGKYLVVGLTWERWYGMHVLKINFGFNCMQYRAREKDKIKVIMKRPKKITKPLRVKL
ncbi:hypothetical protein BpHYR1_010236 [Brachionus plicatilis]|uniref:Uncharacterized protein n=1 Tax=Brachionus plicatilis TaxID=10195 RepID=A0A3M7R0Z9_BRAPC|nr:hypothetical protein BpHYR1_010236 [Brachionus plicatilis]